MPWLHNAKRGLGALTSILGVRNIMTENHDVKDGEQHQAETMLLTQA